MQAKDIAYNLYRFQSNSAYSTETIGASPSESPNKLNLPGVACCSSFTLLFSPISLRRFCWFSNPVAMARAVFFVE